MRPETPTKKTPESTPENHNDKRGTMRRLTEMTMGIFCMVALLTTPACGDEDDGSDPHGGSPGGTDTSTTCLPGDFGCECVDGVCLEGLKCYAALDICIEPEDPPTDGADGDGDSCVPGNPGCRCADGECVLGYECNDDNECEPAGDTDTGGPDCREDYEECEYQTHCCDDDQYCVNFNNGEAVVCAPTCRTHTECPSDCCFTTVADHHVCTISPCDVLCVDTCGPSHDGLYVGDGDCDDGGSGSEYDVCDVGTDCTDCGTRLAP